MMHVMQPVVLDTGWPTTHSSTMNSLSSPDPADVIAVSRAAVTGSVCSSGANMMDSLPQNVGTASFKTLNQADVCTVQSLLERSSDTSNGSAANQTMMRTTANPQKPPKKPLTPYMRFSKAVSCYAFV